MKTEEEINAEIEALRAIKPTVRQKSLFGNNHHDAIDAQIEALSKRMSEDEVWDKHDNAVEDEPFNADNELDQALVAIRWMNDKEDERPSEGWQTLTI
jgi:hypothetical protein